MSTDEQTGARKAAQQPVAPWVARLYTDVPGVQDVRENRVASLTQVVVKLANGSTASVIFDPIGYRNVSKRYQLAVLDSVGAPPPFGDDTIDSLDDDGVIEKLRQLAALTPAPVAEALGDTIIHAYTRADALRDGTLVAAPVLLVERALRMRVPVALTSAAWQDAVAWNETDNARKGTVQDEFGRLSHVLRSARRAMLANRDASADKPLVFEIERTPRAGDDRQTEPAKLALRVDPGEAEGEHVLTIMCADEDGS